MKVKVKHELKKSIHPKRFNIENQEGYCVQVLGDGYCLIEFPQFINGKECLLWYVHENDFFIKL